MTAKKIDLTGNWQYVLLILGVAELAAVWIFINFSKDVGWIWVVIGGVAIVLYAILVLVSGKKNITLLK